MCLVLGDNAEDVFFPLSQINIKVDLYLASEDLLSNIEYLEMLYENLIAMLIVPK